MTFEFEPSWVDQDIARITEESVPPGDELDFDERRLYEVFARDEPCWQVIRSRIANALQFYLHGCEWAFTGYELTGRSVLIRDRSRFDTHVDSAEADIVCTYFPTGHPVGLEVNGKGDPQWTLQDPSRHFCELRLPFEQSHRFEIAPRPGLLMLFPGHIPHSQHPYHDKFGHPHIQVVGNIKLDFIKDYKSHYG